MAVKEIDVKPDVIITVDGKYMRVEDIKNNDRLRKLLLKKIHKAFWDENDTIYYELDSIFEEIFNDDWKYYYDTEVKLVEQSRCPCK